MSHTTSWLLWPFTMIWSLFTFLLELIGRLTAGILGLILMVAGIILTITVLVAPLGIPMLILGLLLILRSLF
jgi:hypothetical protein